MCFKKKDVPKVRGIRVSFHINQSELSFYCNFESVDEVSMSLGCYFLIGFYFYSASSDNIIMGAISY